MGYEKVLYPALEAAANGQPFKLPRFPEKQASGNHRIMYYVAAYTHPNSRSCEVVDRDRAQVLTAAHNQLEESVQKRCGLGVCDGRIEQFTPDPHAGFWLLPVLAAIDTAYQRGDVEVYEAWTRVLGAWFGMWRMGASDDGQVVLPGLRFWPVRRKPPVDRDGWVRPVAGYTMSQCVDGMYRLFSDLPQRDNRGKARDWKWAEKRKAPGWTCIILLKRLLDQGLKVKIEQPALIFPIKTRESLLRRRLWFTRSAAEVGGVLHSIAPAVEVEWREPGKHLVSWRPHEVPVE